ncbi:unnamed protein product [Ambrosiozyma monospora]|uniref:Unnamed protein product n=1 Tax=Ambrosiozyma monospora TaxID=43982 RepID=A0ACB5TGC7_AMBMO|nr:unnamed protein product [Ambrosiozyma monospora]
MNAVILIAVFSVVNTSVFAASRAIVSLSQQGFAPKICGYIDSKGRPLVALTIPLCCGFCACFAALFDQSLILNWLGDLTTVSTVLTWFSILFCHIRFRHALTRSKRNLDEIYYRSQTGLIGSYIGVILLFVCTGVYCWTTMFPLNSDGFSTSSFGKVWILIPFSIVFCLVYMIFYKDWRIIISLNDIDIDSGREGDLDFLKEIIQEEKEYLRSRSCIYRFYRFWC